MCYCQTHIYDAFALFIIPHRHLSHDNIRKWLIRSIDRRSGYSIYGIHSRNDFAENGIVMLQWSIFLHDEEL